ncbi:uncharacterized protein LOC143569831 [Bidens hawaiensis]|uniref:uncharacterized protein LOC143569831 n=1 Tax=Bidens hawaiensis TaxID=980011 RepID=UPI00404A2983
MVLSWILNFVSNELYLRQVFSKFAFDVWEELTETYDKVDGSAVFSLYQKINSVNQNGSTVSDYYQRLNTMWKQFDAMSVRTSLLTKDPLPTIKTTFSIVSRGPNPNLKCTHCNKVGHTVERCFEIVGYPQGPRTRGGQPHNQSNKPVVSNNAVQHKSDPSGCSSGTFLTPDQVSKLLNLLNEKTGEGTSGPHVGGTNQHMVNSDKNVFDQVDVSKFNVTVKHPNGSNATVSKISSIKLSEIVILTDVLVVPEYHVTLLSVHKLAKDRFTHKEHPGDWLGHPSDNVLNVLQTNLKFNFQKNDYLCETCHMAKQHRDPFPLSDHQSKHLGDLIHVDVWGPYRVKSKEVKIIRSDNGSEFVNSQVQTFFRDKGVIHHTSCTYTTQQNGVERQHRHLLNVARSLLFQGNVPLTFWFECVLTAAYLINRTPSSVLEDASKSSLNDVNPDDDVGVHIDHSSEDQQPSSNSRGFR